MFQLPWIRRNEEDAPSPMIPGMGIQRLPRIEFPNMDIPWPQFKIPEIQRIESPFPMFPGIQIPGTQKIPRVEVPGVEVPKLPIPTVPAAKKIQGQLPKKRSTLVLLGVLGVAAFIMIVCSAAAKKGGDRAQQIRDAFASGNATGLFPESGRINPSLAPSTSRQPSLQPSTLPSDQPSLQPSALPSDQPSSVPTAVPSSTPTKPSTGPYYPGPEEMVTRILAIGDVPYSWQQEVALRRQMENLDTNVDFLIHVGDIRSGQEVPCVWDDYETVDNILNQSQVPVFIVPGDNEFNDCSVPQDGFSMWSYYFMNYPDRHWQGQHSFNVVRQQGRPENWAFVHKGGLFIGLNLLGGRVHDALEWKTRHTEQAEWTVELIRQHQIPTTIFGHADPKAVHDDFFLPMRDFIRDELENSLPILYLNGDKHAWEHNSTFYGQKNWERITLVGGVSEKPLLVEVDTSQRNYDHIFRYHREQS